MFRCLFLFSLIASPILADGSGEGRPPPVSIAKVLSSKKVTLNGATYTKYSLFHKKIYRGPRSLTRTLLVPSGACGYTLQRQQTYLLSGLFFGSKPTQLFSSRCTLFDGNEPGLWNQVSPCTLMGLRHIQCPRKPRVTFPPSITMPTPAPVGK
ncbi:unnamed protein product, partial [Mesorhabditis belari]|uniref:Uncharacterized protein n=1 Tax=Mesorhabditis belari TaxID=2138241 RepID=A0AAF3EW13_9BILA